MKALVFTGPSRVEVMAVEEPAVGEGEVVVHVAIAGICGSELHGVRSPGFRVPPLIMGHEFAGTLDDGLRVVVNPVLSCGECDLCGRGLTQLCRRREIIGVHRPGGFAERVSVPRSSLVSLPEDLSWDRAAMIEPAANAVHAWNLAAPPAAARVGIIGAGAIGLACLLVALRAGASEADVAETAGQRAATAATLGATSVGPRLSGEYDVVFDAVGSTATRVESVAHLRPGGTTIWIGLAANDASFDAAALIRSQKRVLGSFAYSSVELVGAIDEVAAWDLSWTRSYPLAEGARVFMALMNGASHPTKALLRP